MASKPPKFPKQGFSLASLPSHIIAEILSWLPVKTIIHCTTVCKLWLHLITHPHFIALQSSRPRNGLILHHSELTRNYFRIADFDDAYGHQDHLPHNTMIKFNLNCISAFQDANIVVDGSINGFLFFRDINYTHETLYICNPMTREYVTLPKPHGVVRYPCVVTHGFGVSGKTGEYKLVRIFQDREIDPSSRSCLRIPYSLCQIYTLGTGTWRSVGHAPFCYDSRFVGMFFNGIVHWLVQDLDRHYMISCFDIEKEVFEALHVPALLQGRRILGSLGVLKDCLCLCDNSSESEIEIWMMKDKSWGKEIIIKKMAPLVGPSFEVVHCLKIFGDRKVLILWGDFFMLYCSDNSGEIQEVDLEQPVSRNSIEAMHYAPTFVSLASIVKECEHVLIREFVCTYVQ